MTKETKAPSVDVGDLRNILIINSDALTKHDAIEAAADELERLRAELEAEQEKSASFEGSFNAAFKEIGELQQENDRLRAELDKYWRWHDGLDQGLEQIAEIVISLDYARSNYDE